MTREKEMEKAAREWVKKENGDFGMLKAFYAGAKYADKHPDLNMATVLAFEAAQRDTIEKAIEWLKKNAWRFMCCDEEADDEYYYDDRKLTRAFKQAMQL